MGGGCSNASLSSKQARCSWYHRIEGVVFLPSMKKNNHDKCLAAVITIYGKAGWRLVMLENMAALGVLNVQHGGVKMAFVDDCRSRTPTWPSPRSRRGHVV